MNIGLFFGSFNPIHTGHLIIANHILNSNKVDKIWFVVSPQNPFKGVNELLDAESRLELARRATLKDGRIKVSKIELKLPRPSFTINTLSHLAQKNSEHEFSIIMGSDAYNRISEWKNSEEITKQYKILVYGRPNFSIENIMNKKTEILDAPLLDISSTEIRKLIKANQSIRYLVPEAVRKLIEKNHFYKK
ncbi:MAG TPA: nicotinate (nicotinamide) nucleotide adenylyltransferase [Chitinophagaceae bacterium]|jgi:nicotinate-nucleotide adenylyltransferase